MSELRRMLREEEILDIIRVSRSTLWRMERTGKFPKATYISANRRRWFQDQILDWQNSVNEFQPNRGRGKGRRKATALLEDTASDDTV